MLRTETCQLLTALPQAGVSAPPLAPGAPGSCKVSAEMGEWGIWGPRGPAPPAPSRPSPGAGGQGCRGDRIPLKIQDLSLGSGSKDRYSSQGIAMLTPYVAPPLLVFPSRKKIPFLENPLVSREQPLEPGTSCCQTAVFCALNNGQDGQFCATHLLPQYKDRKTAMG